MACSFSRALCQLGSHTRMIDNQHRNRLSCRIWSSDVLCHKILSSSRLGTGAKPKGTLAESRGILLTLLPQLCAQIDEIATTNHLPTSLDGSELFPSRLRIKICTPHRRSNMRRSNFLAELWISVSRSNRRVMLTLCIQTRSLSQDNTLR